MDGRGQTHIRIRSTLETDKKSRFKGGPDCGEHTPIEPLLTRVLRCNMGGGVFVWAVESQKQIFGVVGNLRSPALAGWQGPGAGAVNIQICPNPPANYWRSPPKKVWLTVGPLKSSTRLKKKIYCLNFTQYEQIAFHSRH